MSTSRSFDQVKNILGKLDRNIDAARARRLQGPMPAPAIGAPAAVAAVAAPVRPTFVPSPPMTPMPTFGSAAPARSVYGRATPMRSQQTGT
ncbi:MAG TPA: hypothetical protein PKE29_12145 [Phycisphaerales bacterium]|nr:hypothetical protein [Phycisphaerales bacterium]